MPETQNRHRPQAGMKDIATWSPGATDRESPNGLMLGPPGGRQPDRQQLLAAAVKTTLVRFSLAAPPQA